MKKIKKGLSITFTILLGIGLFSSHKAEAFHLERVLEIIIYDYDTGEPLYTDCTLCFEYGACRTLTCIPDQQ